LRQRLRIDQRDQDQDKKYERLKDRGNDNRPAFVGRFLDHTGFYKIVKHSYYLLPTGAKRGVASPVRPLLPAADPETGTAPCPLQLTHATTKGAAIPKLEYVPTRI